MRKKIKMICSKCGREAIKENDKSNENWSVYGTECKVCGGKVKPKIDD